jgi:hypothetical protein
MSEAIQKLIEVNFLKSKSYEEINDMFRELKSKLDDTKAKLSESEQENKRLAEREIKSREEAARFIENQLDFDSDYKCKREKNWCHHYGWQELRELMDFIYEGEPKSKEECLINACEYRKC